MFDTCPLAVFPLVLSRRSMGRARDRGDSRSQGMRASCSGCDIGVTPAAHTHSRSSLGSNEQVACLIAFGPSFGAHGHQKGTYRSTRLSILVLSGLKSQSKWTRTTRGTPNGTTCNDLAQAGALKAPHRPAHNTASQCDPCNTAHPLAKKSV